MDLFERLRQNYEPPHWDEYKVPDAARRTFHVAMGEWIVGDAHGFYLEKESGDGHCDPEHFVETIAGRITALQAIYNGPGTQSPIEEQLVGALVWVYMDWAGFPSTDYVGGPDEHRKLGHLPDGLHYWLSPQAEVAGYRVDFLLWFSHGRHVAGIAIECDGHAFHEKTKEQASRDKARDRAILKAGFPVIRFSGSDIFRGVGACVDEIQAVLSDCLHRVSKDGGMFG